MAQVSYEMPEVLYMAAKNRVINIKYSLVQSGCWMNMCIAISCAAVFLQSRGYSNSRLGFVIAAGSMEAFFLSPVLGGIVDRSDKIDSGTMLWILLASQAVVLTLFYFLPGCSFAVSLFYSLFLCIATCMVPLVTQLCFDMEQFGYSINYGIARGIGSLAYAASAAALGQLLVRHSPAMLTAAGLILTAFEMAMLFLFTFRSGNGEKVSVRKAPDEESASMLTFISENRRFFVLMLGVVFIFFAHQLPCNFLINIVRSVGGNEKDLGNINAFMAVTELPVMLLYDRISRRLGCPRCMRIAVVFFILKSLSIALSSSLSVLFVSHVLQGVSYALLTPALVEYVDLYVPHKDSARGQAVSYAMVTMGTVLASLIGGMLLDSLTVRQTMLTGTAACAVGMVICLFAAEKSKANG